MKILNIFVLGLSLFTGANVLASSDAVKDSSNNTLSERILDSVRQQRYYIKIGVGYKFHQQQAFAASPYSARLEIGVKNCFSFEGVSCGVSHHSQWDTGFPFNEEKEVFKTEFFIDYEYEF